jgi:predicted aspartyl protease
MLFKQAHLHPKTVNLLICIFALYTSAMALAGEAPSPIPMQDKGANTYYIKGEIRGLGATEFMVDTGSGYVTINEHSLEILKGKGEVTYVKDLMGILADGQQKIFPVYRIASIHLGDSCELKDIEAAVFPGRTRQILGLSGLKKAGAFTFSFDPPQLTLSNCASVS